MIYQNGGYEKMEKTIYVKIPNFIICLRLMEQGHTTIMDISKISNISFVTIHKIRMELFDKELIMYNKRNIVLTDKGKRVNEAGEFLIQQLEFTDEELYSNNCVRKRNKLIKNNDGEKNEQL
jgi:predicted transcriptional regulator